MCGNGRCQDHRQTSVEDLSACRLDPDYVSRLMTKINGESTGGQSPFLFSQRQPPNISQVGNRGNHASWDTPICRILAALATLTRGGVVLSPASTVVDTQTRAEVKGKYTFGPHEAR